MSARAATQSIFTVITKVDPARADALAAHLAELENSLGGTSGLPLREFAHLHFCSFTIFPDASLGPYLVFENNVDGTPQAHIELLCAAATAALHAIYSFCLDYPYVSAPQPALLSRYFHEHLVGPTTAFVGNVGRTVERIKSEAALVGAIGAFLDDYRAADDTPPQAIFAAVRDFVKRDACWNWVWTVPPRLSLADRLTRWAIGPLVIAGLCSNPPAALALGAAFLFVLRRHERTDPVDIPGPPPGQIQTLAAREDRGGQNHMASLCYVKPGTFRRRTIKLVLFFANVVARISTNGRLVGLDSLHFAHWALIDDDRRLLFLTNYDGSWENYLDDFIDKVAAGLTAIWSNTRNFPRTSFLIFDGARDERRFKAIARTTQAYTNLWYSAYPMLSVASIEKNTAICAALSRRLDAAAAAAWLNTV